MTGSERLKHLGVAGFRPHFLTFAAASVAIIALAAATDWRWLYRVLAGWGVLLLVHYLVHKTFKVDQRWVDNRTEELRLTSYDRSHIESIRSEPIEADTPGIKGRDRGSP